MCWNEHVSLNTFLFSMFVLFLIIYNNAYTQYKIKDLNNPWMYLFFASFIFMQLIEFFIWRNIDNKFYNNIFSTMAAALIIFQPLASLMLLSNVSLRNTLLSIYIATAVPYFIYKFLTHTMHSTVSKNGNLNWVFSDPNGVFFGNTPFAFVCWLFFFLFSLFYERKWSGFLFGFLSMCIFYYNYAKEQTFGSMWCWIVNSIMIYYAFYLLLYLPFCEKKKLC